jgi:hypothetical protein
VIGEASALVVDMNDMNRVSSRLPEDT